MSYNGSGTFNINTAGQPVVTGTTITSTAFNLLTTDLATGLTTALTKDGQTTPTANIPMGGFKVTGLGAGSAATDAAQYGQLQANATTIATVSGTDTLTGSLTPALSAYATGNLFSFVAANTNTGATTINLNSLGAKSITKQGTTALVSGDLVSGQIYLIEYDGTRFQLINPSGSGVSNISFGSTGLTPSTATSGAVTVAGILAIANGGTNSTATATAGGVGYGTGTAHAYTTVGTSGQVLQSNGASAPTWATIATSPTLVRSARTSNTILGTADVSTLIAITSGTFTQTFTAAATLGSGWFCYIQNSGTGDITLDPNGSETIDGLTSFIMFSGEVRLVQCDGTGFNSVVLNAGTKTFTTSGTWTKPPGYTYFSGFLWGGGGSGSKHDSPGGGGGGGACVPFTISTSALSSTESVTIAAGGIAVNTTDENGNVGGNSTFDLLTAYGGAGGTGSNGRGGGGGGAYGAGSGVTAGGPQIAPSSSNSADNCSGFGGGTGSSATSGGAGRSIYGGGGGGGDSNNTGGSSVYGGAGGSGANGVLAGGISLYGGNGGASSGSGTAGTGVQPAGGGGGTLTGTSGAGGAGKLIIWGII